MTSSSWLGPVTEAVGALNDPLFLLLLDDYALCSPVQNDKITRALQTMAHHPDIDLFPLSWYPAQKRLPHPNLPSDILHLQSSPILLQAALWRRDFFLHLAKDIDPRASAWGFESAATQKLRSSTPAPQICAFSKPEPRWLGGPFLDGFDKSHWPLPYHNLIHRGRLALHHEPFLHQHGFTFPSRGLGDTLANLAHSTGLTTLVHHLEHLTQKPCGCSARRQWLNEKLPYT